MESARLAVLLLTLCGLGACADPSPPNLVLITLDTTRADRLGCYGHAGAETPALDHFAKSAVLFENAYSTSSWTLASHASLMTGLLPMQHGAQTAPDGDRKQLGYGVRPLDPGFNTLAERLSAAGYRTAAVVAGPALRHELGIAQGFEFYDDEFRNPLEKLVGKRAKPVADQALAYVEEFGDAPFFLFVNFFDPHAPYKPPAPHGTGIDAKAEGLMPALLAELAARAPPKPVAQLAPEIRSALDEAWRGYDAEIAYMDLHLGRLLDGLLSGPRGADTLVVITSDHGESFGEHFYLSHGAHLYEDNVRVPLLVRYPGGAGGGVRVSDPTQNHWVFSTFLQAARLSDSPSPLDLRDRAIVTEVRRSDSNVRLGGSVFDRDLRAIYQWPYKLIESSSGAHELYDLSQSTAELDNLLERKPALADELAALLANVSEVHPPLYEAGSRVELRPETEEALRALGYLD